MKKIFLAIILFLFTAMANAQIKKITLQASGLTCSMCSNAINKSLQSLDFVNKVYANIKMSSFEILFKDSAIIDFDKIKSKVEAAGFSVSKFYIQMNFDNISVTNDKHVQQNGIVYHFLNVNKQVLNGEKTLLLIDKGFLSSKQYKKNSKFTDLKCYQSGVAEECCNKNNIINGTRIYHVTI